MDERKSVYAVVDDEQMSRVRGALEDVTSLVDSLRVGCEIAYRREPTQAEGDAHEYRHDQSMLPFVRPEGAQVAPWAVPK